MAQAIRTEIVVPRGSIPGTPERNAATIANARDWAQYVENDARPLVRSCRELRQVRAWETWLTDEPKTWERFCQEALGYDADFIAEIEDGVAILEERGHTGPIPLADIRALDAQDIAEQEQQPHGGDRKSEKYRIKIDDVQLDSAAPTGNSRQRALRKLRKSRPDLHERVLSGGLTPHGAMVEAGFRERTITVPADVGKAAKVLARHFDITALILALVKERNADADQDALMAMIDEAVDEVRQESETQTPAPRSCEPSEDERP